jgi:hypothetical protein
MLRGKVEKKRKLDENTKAQWKKLGEKQEQFSALQFCEAYEIMVAE